MKLNRFIELVTMTSAALVFASCSGSRTCCCCNQASPCGSQPQPNPPNSAEPTVVCEIPELDSVQTCLQPCTGLIDEIAKRACNDGCCMKLNQIPGGDKCIAEARALVPECAVPK